MSDQVPERVVIVGAGLAGASAARTLRDEGFAGDITLLGSEGESPYLRPPLSKKYLAGKLKREAVFVQKAEWYEQHAVNLQLGSTATSLDRERRQVSLADGSVLDYDRLLLATGSSPRQSTLPGAELAGVHYLRTLADWDSLREVLSPGGLRLVVIGSGWIGMEVAAAARSFGNEVTLLERGTVPLGRVIGDDAGRVFAAVHTAHGVVIRTEVEVSAIVGSAGQCTGVLLTTGELVPADGVLIGIGAIPNTGLASAAGLEVGDGVLVDARLQTSDPNIFAAGDIANSEHPIGRIRVRNEHWANALQGGQCAAKTMMGQDVTFDAIPYFYSDQFELSLEYAGFGGLTDGAEVVLRGDRDAREFITFWLRDGRVVAGMNINVWGASDDIQALIRRGENVDRQRLADEAIDL